MDWEEPHKLKRRRLESSSTEEVIIFANAQHIYQALKFQSNVAPQVKESVNRFKDFLSGICKTEDGLQKQKDLRILKDYCDLQASSSKQQIDFPDLISTWSHAVEVRNDPIASAIPAALAQFFRAISGVLEFREFGLSLCYSLLKRDQLKLLDRGLSSQRTKEHLISPCLRLLTEVTSFDGGTMANHVFGQHDILFKRLEFLLDTHEPDSDQDRRRPTVRRMVLRLLIANFKFLDNNAKPEFLLQGRLFRALATGLIHDGDDIVVDVTKAIDTGVVGDVVIPRTVKLRFFTPEVLAGIAALYGYENDLLYPDSASNVRDATHRLLMRVCTTTRGVVISQNGWYPIGYDPTNKMHENDNDHIDLGLDSPLYFDDYSNRLPVKNTNLAVFSHILRPEADVLQAELLTKMLQQMPELVAEYFTRQRKFSVSADVDAQWRGQFAFYYSIIQSPVPKNLGWQDGIPQYPPPISVVIESILPRPFNRATITRFFTLSDEVLILSGSRLLSVALDKLGQVLNIFQSHQHQNILWTQAYHRLIEAMLDRVPKYKDLVEAYHRCGKGNEMLTTALFECISMYHRLLPEAVVGSKFDVGPILIELIGINATKRAPDQATNYWQQVSSLTIIARLSPATKWWSKSGTDDLTLFTSIMQAMLANEDLDPVPEIFDAVKSTIVSSGIIYDSSASFAALIESLRATKDFEPSGELYAFVDNSIHRAIQKPVKYVDRIQQEQQLVSDKTSLSILPCAVAEQWSFALQKYTGQKKILKTISKWIARYFSALDGAGENFRVLEQFKEEMIRTAEAKYGEYLQSSFEKSRKKPVLQQGFPLNGVEPVQPTEDNDRTSHNPKERLVDLNETLGHLDPLADSLENIDRWDGKTDIEHAIQSGRLAKLIRCISSAETEIRVQTFHILQSLAHVIDESSHPEKAQLYLLLGEICETIRKNGISTQTPAVVSELAVKLLQILADPSHKLFGKANKFLLRGPSWDMKRLIQSWTEQILFNEPESDDASAWSEDTEWYVSWLADGLKTSHDMEFYRRSGVFEKLLALYESPATMRSTRRMILSVLWRAICVGGADTLITRIGLHKWLEIAAIRDNDHAGILGQLSKSLNEASDEDIISAWTRTCPLLKDDE